MTNDFKSGLKGQIAVITGGGRGIGAAIGQKLANLGAVAVLCGRTRTRYSRPWRPSLLRAERLRQRSAT
jgi:NAD(P)-dependent dehydrogenase (short-subunit alcohol dehydrogenase family)